MSLKERRQDQEKIYNKVKREHQYCLKEILCNIDELENAKEMESTDKLLKDIIQSCPIDYKNTKIKNQSGNDLQIKKISSKEVKRKEESYIDMGF